ncbi:hypothetical protein GCM10010193_37010 [Kitasatospora atroaurantiaca]|uniref:Glycosyl hydrolase family 18 (Putative chitinase) n=1 Tax=Kitasatospora atroaurantiaca TaxID=285545 RepID=A0A561ET21_9ACTN|nr:hypothetical protein [Kitasatospora atroaurantiaca]TWE18756.1 hypothetical protein FB465_3845 [Kitasatospora atroaurantiaca]
MVLSFVQPLKLLNATTDSRTTNGVPIGMNSAVVDYFTSHGVRVMLSIGGITCTDAWNTALAQNATLLGQRAGALASQLGVGIKINYEQSAGPNLTGLQAFIDAYRAAHPYDVSGTDPTARLTIDVAAGDRWLIALDQYATAHWLTTGAPVGRVLNGAQDVAVTAGIDYWVTFAPAAKADGAVDFSRWGAWEESVACLEARGLTDREDFALDLIGAGRPIPAQGLMFLGWFTEKAMTEVDDILVRVRVTDRVGDTHERVIALMKGAIRSPQHPDPPPF